MLTKEQRDEILRLAAELIKAPSDTWGSFPSTALGRLVKFTKYIDSITAPDKPLIYGCHYDLEPDMKPDGCVLDYGKPKDCVYAKILVKNGRSKEDCWYWKPIGDSNE